MTGKKRGPLTLGVARPAGSIERKSWVEQTGRKPRQISGESQPRHKINQPSLEVWIAGDAAALWWGDGVRVRRWPDEVTKGRESSQCPELVRADLIMVDEQGLAEGCEGTKTLLGRAAYAHAKVVVCSATGGTPCAGNAQGDLWIGNVVDEWLPALLPVNVADVNPRGFAQSASWPSGRVSRSQGRWHVMHGERDAKQSKVSGATPCAQVGSSEQTEVAQAHAGGGAKLEFESFGRLVEHLQRAMGVFDVADMHDDDWNRAEWVVHLCSAGVPVIAKDLSVRTRKLLGAGLVDALDGLSEDDLTDRRLRELHSVKLRRAAIESHSKEARTRDIAYALNLPLWHRPLVTMVVAVGRSDNVEHLLEQASRQRYPRVELIVVFHGVSPSREDKDALERLSIPWQAAHAPSWWVLGDVLNLGVECSSGEVIAKMDDDDWYGRDHIQDLVLAFQYSSADLVGKAAEFVYIGALDITIRRFGTGAESASRTLAGGAMAITREALRAVGGWRRQPRSVDQLLIHDVGECGMKIHRTHAFSYVLSRRTSGHTWARPIEEFLQESIEQRRGLALRFADIES